MALYPTAQGNAGSQSVVLTCRKLLQHEEILVRWRPALVFVCVARDQLKMGFLLGFVLPTGSHVRHSALALGPQAAATEDLLTCLTLAVSTLLIATVAAAIGTALPKLLNQFRSDPGQAAAMIQARKGSQRDLPKALRGSERL